MHNVTGFWLCVSLFALVLIVSVIYTLCCYWSCIFQYCCYKPPTTVYGSSESTTPTAIYVTTPTLRKCGVISSMQKTGESCRSCLPFHKRLLENVRKILKIESKKSVPWDDEETMLIPGGSGRRTIGRPLHWVGNSPKCEQDEERKLETVSISDITAACEDEQTNRSNVFGNNRQDSEQSVDDSTKGYQGRGSSSISVFSDVSMNGDADLVRLYSFDDTKSRNTSVDSNTDNNIPESDGSSDYHPFDERMYPSNSFDGTELTQIAELKPGDTHTPSNRNFSIAKRYSVRSARLHTRGARWSEHAPAASRHSSESNREFKDIPEAESDNGDMKAGSENEEFAAETVDLKDA
ncbi:uncharacterized protein LOC108949752 [Ciona intestinalis]